MNLEQLKREIVQDIRPEYEPLIRPIEAKFALFRQLLDNLEDEEECIEASLWYHRNYVDYLKSTESIEIARGEEHRNFKQLVYRADKMKERKFIFKKSLAAFYVKKMEHQEKTRELYNTFDNNPFSWKEACDLYSDCLNMNRNDVDLVLGYTYCLLKSLKFDTALKHLKEYKLNSRVEYLTMRAKAHRHRFEYNEAEEFLLKAATVAPAGYTAEGAPAGNKYAKVDIERELQVVRHLQSKKTAEVIQEYRDNHVRLDNDETTKGIPAETTYKILSIDGGGIRSILPAYWLCEIEKRAHKPISHLFDMIAGVSTSAIIAAGLTAPKNDDCITPLYTASDILELFLNKSSSMFEKDSTQQLHKYNANGRYNLFSEYFGELRVKQALSELVIPAKKANDEFRPFSFNKQEQEDYRYVDALMATTATAPIYFPSYKLHDDEFVDLNCLGNNPSDFIFYHALEKRLTEIEHVSMLSLGTGDLVINENYLYDNIEFENDNVLFNREFELKILKFSDCSHQMMYRDMQQYSNPNYKRWQMYLQNPIAFDDCKRESLDFLTENARQYIEDLDASKDNSLNKLIESLV